MGFNKRITSDKTKDIEFKTKLDDLVKEDNNIDKRLKADMINKYSILNRAEYFSIDEI